MSWQRTNKTGSNYTERLNPINYLISIFFTSLIHCVLASKNLLEEYSTERSNVIFNTKGSWSINRNIFNEKGRRYYLTSNSLGILWVGYIVIIVVFNSF